MKVCQPGGTVSFEVAADAGDAQVNLLDGGCCSQSKLGAKDKLALTICYAEVRPSRVAQAMEEPRARPSERLELT